MEGFIIQKTTFPFIAIVHDDASTDKTAEIIEEYALKYPDIIKPILEKRISTPNTMVPLVVF